ncbi:NAD(P)H dehydrogenase (quinone) [Streptomyces chrestomyceticus JCM 4735]|uniref:NAD(P)H dehydrogenase (Quinone) n=1 Tax=Streptomyces chrestomyceticus JCM 4735 TaxID=1306181 RepID=A0A7U9KVF5_9ACTN|nr:hypothetical protein [Streptomyces chrestomyceticus]GCD36086.1 NAD(P)H dehydrogenase (quinone) [Streptomyces chrestomyceticus JCM 4735]
MLRAGRALVLNTSDTPAERERREFGDPLRQIWAACVLPYVGVTDVRRHVFRTVSDSTEVERSVWLREARRQAAGLLARLRAGAREYGPYGLRGYVRP